MSILHKRFGASIALLAISTTVVATVATSPAAAAPQRADLTVDLTVSHTEIPVTGRIVSTDVHIANAGAASADGITLVIDLPANANVAGEGPATGSPWQCTLGHPIQCTHPTLAPGETAAPLNLPIRVLAGSDGDSVTITATGTTSSPEAAVGNNSDRVTLVYDASIVYPDLYTASATPIPDYLVIEGDFVKYPMQFGNRGNIAADDIRVRVVASQGLFGGVGNQSDPSWQCTTVVANQEWECVNGPLPVDAQTPVLSFSGQVPAGGQPGDRLPVTVTVTTSTPNEDPIDNVHEGGFEYGVPSYVSGLVWLDADQDGQRDTVEEPVLTYELGLTLVPTDGGAARSVPVNADGTYRLAVHPGRYHLGAELNSSTYRFTLPDVGDDATDSDVHLTYDSPFYQAAESSPADIAEGGEVIFDIGLITVG